jgi:hypothetical protein
VWGCGAAGPSILAFGRKISLSRAFSTPRSDFMAFEHSLEDRETWFKYSDQVQRKLSFRRRPSAATHVISATERFSKIFLRVWSGGGV